jgi:hypothetical protein
LTGFAGHARRRPPAQLLRLRWLCYLPLLLLLLLLSLPLLGRRLRRQAAVLLLSLHCDCSSLAALLGTTSHSAFAVCLLLSASILQLS